MHAKEKCHFKKTVMSKSILLGFVSVLFIYNKLSCEAEYFLYRKK